VDISDLFRSEFITRKIDKREPIRKINAQKSTHKIRRLKTTEEKITIVRNRESRQMLGTLKSSKFHPGLFWTGDKSRSGCGKISFFLCLRVTFPDLY
jgi:hypothetical protein